MLTVPGVFIPRRTRAQVRSWSGLADAMKNCGHGGARGGTELALKMPPHSLDADVPSYRGEDGLIVLCSRFRH